MANNKIDRIKSLSQQKEIGFVGWEFDGGKVEANTEANRLQILSLIHI